jgi:hypothetical protein
MDTAKQSKSLYIEDELVGQSSEEMDIQQHYEKMNPEFSRIDFDINKFGYKMDGKGGIKICCNLASLKSADYIEEKGEKIAFVEFSDLARQYHNILGDIEILREAKFERQPGKKISNDIYLERINSVRHEISEKFKDSIHILNEAKKLYKNTPDSFNSKPHAILVTAPISDDDQPCRKEEIGRYLDALKNHVILNLPEVLFKKVHVLSIEAYAATQ